MIIVPVEENKVGIAGLNDARLRAADYGGSGLEAVGAGLAKLGESGQQFASAREVKRQLDNRAIDLGDRHRRNLDDAAAKKAYVAFSNAVNPLLHGDDGILNRVGSDAHDAFPDVAARMADAYDNALAPLDPDVRAAVAPALAERVRTYIALSGEHVREQGAVEQRRQSAELQQVAARDAVAQAADPDLHDHYMATGENAIRQQGRIDGVSPEEAERQVAEYVSRTHADTIGALTPLDPGRAANWLARFGGAMTDQDKRMVQGTLGTALDRAQTIADLGTADRIDPMTPAATSANLGSALSGDDMAGRPAVFMRDAPSFAGTLAPGSLLTPEAATSAAQTATVPLANASSPSRSATPSDAATIALSAAGLARGDDGDIVVDRSVPRRAPFVSGVANGQIVLAAQVKPQNATRLTGRDVIATPQMRAIAEANIELVRVRAGQYEKTAVAYLMPDGSVEVRPLAGKGTTASSTETGDFMHGKVSGPGRPLFIIHGHIEKHTGPSVGSTLGRPKAPGMVDDPDNPESKYLGDTYSLMTTGLPVATVYNGYIGWHERRGGQLMFSAPVAAVSKSEASALQANLNVEQNRFLTAKQKHAK